VFDQGKGTGLIVIPGVQGRWEWMKPALTELAKRCRVMSYTLCGDFGSDMKFDPALGFDNFIKQLDQVFDRTGLERAALCGVSYGGLIALRYAALRPERVTSLVFVSAPAPGWVPNDRQQRYLAHPWRSTPARPGGRQQGEGPSRGRHGGRRRGGEVRSRRWIAIACADDRTRSAGRSARGGAAKLVAMRPSGVASAPPSPWRR